LSLTSILCTATLLPSTPPRPAEEPNLPSAEAPTDAPPAGRRLRLLDWGTYTQYFRRPVLAGLLWEFFLFTLAFATFTSGFALFAERRFTWHGVPFGPRQVGYVFAYSGFLGIILQGGLIGRLVKRFGEVRLITVGFLAAAIGYCLLGLSNTIALLLVAATFASFGSGVLRPALTSLITQNVSRGEQGVVLGLTQSLQSIALIVGPAIAGALIARGYLTTWGLWAGAITCFALVLNRKARGARQDAHGVEPARS
jgi:MFS family permease